MGGLVSSPGGDGYREALCRVDAYRAVLYPEDGLRAGVYREGVPMAGAAEGSVLYRVLRHRVVALGAAGWGDRPGAWEPVLTVEAGQWGGAEETWVS